MKQVVIYELTLISLFSFNVFFSVATSSLEEFRD